jgi:capsule polysaccharide export protein KpsC/LpsZ
VLFSHQTRHDVELEFGFQKKNKLRHMVKKAEKPEQPISSAPSSSDSNQGD